MPLDINGYNNAFRGFVQFAENRAGLGLKGAAVKATKANARCNLSVASATSTSWASRTEADERDNDNARLLFRNAVIDMFGGSMKNVPKSVRKAMKLDDYFCGKPLTARRILAVKAAIDKEGSARQAALGRFWTTGVRTEALKLGFTREEIPKLARATHFYAQAAGIDEMAAMREVAAHGTKANRLALYGGRFLESVENFQAGLALLDSFQDWYGDVNRFVLENNKGRHFADARTATQMNAAFKVFCNAGGQPGLEAMVFQDIAADPKFDLSKRGEDAFGFAGNAAMRFFGRNGQNSIFGTIFNLPPANRRVLFAASDALAPLIADIGTAALLENNKKGRIILGNGVFAARVLRNIGKLEAILAKKGRLTAKDVFRTCFPDIDARAMLQARTNERVAQLDRAIDRLKNRGGDPQTIRQYEDMKKADLAALRAAKDADLYCLATLNYWYDDHLRATIRDALEQSGLADGPRMGAASTSIMETMVSSGCTVEEAVESYRTGHPLPPVRHHAGFSMELHEFPSKGLQQMKLDLTRGTNYSRPGTEQNYLEPDAQTFRFAFPGEPAFACGTDADAEKVEGKVRRLCGEGHELQAQIVGANLSQTAAGPIKGALANFGIHNDEHAVLDYALSKDNRTGAITIRYSSPDGLPVRFSWTCTVGVDGTCTTTPLELNGN